MKAVIQRVTSASVVVDNMEIARIDNGYLVLLGVVSTDTEKQMKLLADKTAGLRIFSDENGKMNLSIRDVSGSVLVVSQFTLCADISHSRRPSFTPSADPKSANRLYLAYCEELSELGIAHVEHGEFGADMKVSLVNDGPVTIVMDTDIWERKVNYG